MKNTLKITVITLPNRPEPLLCKSIMKRKRREGEGCCLFSLAR